MSILVITTGGTIGALPYADPVHPPIDSAMPEDGRDLVREALMSVFPHYPTRVASCEPRDSKAIDDAYRGQLLNIVKAAPENHIIITHGTDCILLSADYFDAQPDLGRKTIILTGAMIPLANGPPSDGYQNLAFALAHPPAEAGVFIVLSDDVDGVWQPRLYPHRPGLYEKVYDTGDARRSHLRRRS